MQQLLCSRSIRRALLAHVPQMKNYGRQRRVCGKLLDILPIYFFYFFSFLLLFSPFKVCDAAIHPDTGEKIFLPFRLSAFVPLNVLICAGLVMPNPSVR
jgi:hypothetical protein